ncbi:(2Fe-2S)-binding protein [Streptomyces sp. HUAS MG47]|uniref:(2Fe-2S)-binding protein n=1 Tax=Streptomyces solicamelliae TaxID=3231716 RepID=UPI003877D3D2
MSEVSSSALGGFFALARSAPPAGAHRPLGELYGGSVAPLTARVDRVAASLRTSERRVAASTAQLGLAARLWSVALGCAALDGTVPSLRPDELYWDGALGAPDDLWWAGQEFLPATVASLRLVVVDRHLVPLHDTLRRDGRVAPRLLWGNAGSALAGALRQLVRVSPGAGRRAGELVAGLLREPELAGTVQGPALRRTTCCLYYRCPGGGLCGDCVFDRMPGTGLETGPSAP